MVAKRLKFHVPIKIHNVKTALELLDGLKEEIGLSDDDLTVIVFTSLDRDWFTNMIILQGEFLKWFNLNFEGESREETDFLDNQHDQWLAINAQSKRVIDKYADLKGDKEVILTT